jgi:hypothetical protein
MCQESPPHQGLSEARRDNEFSGIL